MEFCKNEVDYIVLYKGYKEQFTDTNTIDIMDLKSKSEKDTHKNKKKKAFNKFKPKIEEKINEKTENIQNKKDVLIMAIPSSKKDSHNPMVDMAKIISKENNFTDGTSLLKRNKDIKAAHLGGNRSKKEHDDTIDVNKGEEIKDKHVILIDDVITTGVSMHSCYDKINSYKPKSISCIALAKTCIDD